MTPVAALLALTLANPYGYPPYPPPSAPPYPPPAYPPPAYPPAYPPRPPAYVQPPRAYQPRGVVGIVAMPLGSSTLSTDTAYDAQGNVLGSVQYPADLYGSVALELRSPFAGRPFSGAQLRVGGEFSKYDRIVDVAFKYNFLDRLPIQPFVTLGVGAGNLDPETDWRACFSASLGIDLFLTPQLFLSAELKGRAFADPSQDALNSGNAVYGTGVRQSMALFGLGIFL